MKRFFLIGLLCVGSLQAQAPPSETLRGHIHTLKEWLRDSVRVHEQMQGSSKHVMDAIFDWEEITRRAFEDNWGNISKTWQKRFTEAVRLRIIRESSEWLQRIHRQISEPYLRWAEEEVNEPRAKAGLDVLLNGEMQRVNFRLQLSEDAWKIYDVRTENFRLIKTYLMPYSAMLSDGYNNEYVEARILQSPVMVIDDFSLNESDDYPKSWGWRKKDDPIMTGSFKLYRIQKEGDNLYLAGQSRTQPVILVKPFSYNLKEFPILSWQWRVETHPTFGSNTMDRAAAVTVIFYQNWIGVPVTLSYVWSHSSPTCNIITRKDFFYTSYSIVLRSGGDPGGRWLTEQVNPYEDYRRIFGEYPPEQVIGISVLNDPPSADSYSAMDYDNFIARVSADSLSCSR